MDEKDISENIEELEKINTELANLNLKKKALSAKIIENSKNNDIISLSSFLNDLGENETKIKELNQRKQELLKNLRNFLKERELLFENYRMLCDFNGIISVIGSPGTGKLDMIFKFLTYCSKRDSFLMVLKDRERITEMMKKYNLNSDILLINPLYYMKKYNIEKLDDVEKIAVRLSKEIYKAVLGKRDPIIVVHRSNDLSLDRINEVSNLLKEEFWIKFIENLSPKDNKLLIIFNCDDYEGECINLMGISDYMVRVELKDNKSKYFVSKLNL